MLENIGLKNKQWHFVYRCRRCDAHVLKACAGASKNEVHSAISKCSVSGAAMCYQTSISISGAHLCAMAEDGNHPIGITDLVGAVFCIPS